MQIRVNSSPPFLLLLPSNFLFCLKIAIELDPENWKGYWRKGVSLMSLSKRIFRTKEAIEAFEKCARCSSLPENKRKDVQTELYKARERMAQQEAEVSKDHLKYFLIFLIFVR